MAVLRDMDVNEDFMVTREEFRMFYDESAATAGKAAGVDPDGK